ncbi:hypothetical protein [Pseudomonas sp. Irchel s3h17]|uniref:hypothetical protein n=1 Tax=Pseudomonas sp. Irchel s3h17 TaxID=2009182 RepID=UPI000BA3A452|nr:hypothetical protein [Pseudomonas sp. Irchel s3h17]
MNTENIEMLLERLVTINEEISGKLDDVKYDLGAIKEELNWVGEHTYAKVVYDGLNDITEKLHAVEMGITSIESNTSST